MKRIIGVVFPLFLHFAGLTAQEDIRSGVQIWQEEVILPTYLVDKPDRIPRFYEGRAYQGAQGRIYPYPIFESLSDTRVEEGYEMVMLENEFLRLELLPEIGGRLFGAVDKTNGYDFIYRQHVIKPGLIGMLGAWISGGIEWNFPHHHRATAYMPVDVSMQRNENGSCTAWIGELEIRHRMKFMLGVTLYPGRSYFEVTFKPYNRTPFIHSFLYFANTGVHTSEEYQVIFPPSTRFGTYHGKNQFVQWPIAQEVYNRVDYTEGVDISWWKNHPEWTSIFAWNYEDDFVGGYDHGKEAGIMLVSNHHIAPGKKFWTWSTGPRGQMWDAALTETDGPELELMIGGYSDNQPDYSWLQPYESKSLRQYFYPIRKIGSVKNANREAAVNLEKIDEQRVRIGFNTTSVRKEATVELSATGQRIFKEVVDIGPATPYVREVDLKGPIVETELTLRLLSAEGRELVRYSPVKKDRTEMPEKAVPPDPPEKIPTVEQLYLTGLRLEQFYNPSFDPEPYYKEALRRDPENYRVNTATGLRDLRNGRFQNAEHALQKAVDRITHNHTKARDGEAFYYLGLCQRFLGKDEDAYDHLYQATWSQAFHTAAYYQLAELDCRRGKLTTALEHLERSLSTNAHHYRAINLQAAIHRQGGSFSDAVALADRVRSQDPLNAWALCETYLALKGGGKSHVAGQALTVLKRQLNKNREAYLELAMNYSGAGFWEDAIEVLYSVYLEGDDSREAYPMVYYFLGHFWSRKGDEEKARNYYRMASQQSPDYCFPFRLESIGILEEASEQIPGDAKAPFYLGNLLYDLQPGRALRSWERSASLDEGYWLVHRNLGMAYDKVDQDKNRAIEHYHRAIGLKPDDQRLLYELDLISAAAREDPRERLDLLKRHHKAIADNHVSDALSREVMLMVQLERYEEALKVMNENQFKQWEGISKAYNSYVDAHLFLALKKMKAKEYAPAFKHMEAAGEFPENMMVAKPYRGGRSGEVYYFTGTLLDAMGEDKKADRYFRLCVDERQYEGIRVNHFYQGMALKELGYQRKAEEIFNRLIDEGEKQLNSSTADFFAKFGEKETEADKRSDAYFLIGLGHTGKGNQVAADRAFSEAVRLNINHVWASKYHGGL